MIPREFGITIVDEAEDAGSFAWDPGADAGSFAWDPDAMLEAGDEEDDPAPSVVVPKARAMLSQRVLRGIPTTALAVAAVVAVWVATVTAALMRTPLLPELKELVAW